MVSVRIQKTPSRMIRLLRLLVGMLLCNLVLSGCDMLGKKSKPPLEGRRIPVVTEATSKELNLPVMPVTVSLEPSVQVQDWHQPGFDSFHRTPHIKLSGSGKTLQRTGSFPFGTGLSPEGRILSSPIVVGDILYGIDAQTRLIALSLKTKGVLWSKDLSPDYKMGSYTLGGGVSHEKGQLFATTAYGDLVALDAKTGCKQWQKALGSPCRAAPVIKKDRVYTLTVDNQLQVFDAKTGELVWSHAGISENLGLLGTSVPAVDEDMVVVAYGSGEVFGLRPETGSVVWSEHVSSGKRGDFASSLSDIQAMPVISQQAVYISNQDGKLAALHLQSGRRLWERDLACLQTPAISGDFLFVLTQNNTLLCLNKLHGELHWSTCLPVPKGCEGKNTWSGPILANGRLYVVGIQGCLMALSPQTGAIEQTLALPTGGFVPPVATSQGIFVLTDDGVVTSFQPAP